MLNRAERREQHYDDSVLLAYLDCEQTEREHEEVRDHLESCWTCRARLGRLEETISAFIDFRDRAFSAETAQPPQGFGRFSARLARLVDEPVKERFWCNALTMARQLWGSVSTLRMTSPLVYPVAVVAVMLAIAIAMSVLGPKKDNLPSATELLAQSAWAETIDRGQVQRRTLILEKKDAISGRVLRRQRIESWKSGSGPRARRVYDENNAVIGGSWTKADGARVQYQSKKGKRVSHADEQLPEGGSVWELSPSASDFGRLVGSDAQLSVEVTPAVYIVGYSNTSAARPRVRSATLTLQRRDLHAIAQVFVIEERSALSEYRIEEVDYERRSLQAADYRYFEPDFETQLTAPIEPAPAFAPATLDQEVQLFGGLDSVGALVGEQIDVSRLPSGELRLHGLVATAERRNEILHALGGITQSRAVKVELSTLEEAQRLQSRQNRPMTARLRLDEIEIAKTTFPAEPDLRTYLQKSGVIDRNVSDEVYRLSTATLEHAASSRDHATALQRIAALFTRSEVRAMGDSSRAQWASMIDKHAAGFALNLRQMRADVGPVFGIPSRDNKHAGIPQSESVWGAIHQLDQMAGVINDGVRRSFTIRAQGEEGIPVQEREFWEMVNSAIALADSIPSRINEE